MRLMMFVTAQAMVERLQEGKIRNAGLKSGIVTENELEEMAQAWLEWNRRDDATLGMMHGEVLIQKEE